ncbi:MAG TPA: glycosyltransferase family 4 protein [Candidatus Binataceae bacterium]|nr:glycosyltransferase family 4 protein [Candidatus Binataceae bacterium]
MRVLYLNPIGSLGGAERVLIDIVGGLREARPDWDLHLISGAEGAIINRTQALGVNASVVQFPSVLARTGDAIGGRDGDSGETYNALSMLGRLCAAGVASTAYVAKLRAAIRRIAPDLIHSNGFKMHLIAAHARPVGVPVIWHIHDYLGQRPVMARLLPIYRSRCAVAIANSRSVAADLKAVCPGLDVQVVYNAVDLHRFSPAGPQMDLDALANLPAAPSDTVRVGLVATMGHWKGHRVFLDAMSRIPAEMPVRGYIIGGPLYETDRSQRSLDELRASADGLAASGRVGFTGFIEEPNAAMRSLDVVVHASTDPEPFGLVIAEAMASGRPVVTTACGGAAEIVTDGVDSLTYPMGDAAALAERIIRLAADPALRRRLGNNGREAAERRFDSRRLAGEVIDTYRRVIPKAA